jgi:hypothetical protein
MEDSLLKMIAGIICCSLALRELTMLQQCFIQDCYFQGTVVCFKSNRLVLVCTCNCFLSGNSIIISSGILVFSLFYLLKLTLKLIFNGFQLVFNG